MKKLTLALVAALTVTASHAAFAGGEQMDKRRAQESQTYFKQHGTHAEAPRTNPQYDFKSQPEQRLADRNDAYFQNQKSSGATAAGANKADYTFSSQPDQRTAARSMEYFKK